MKETDVVYNALENLEKNTGFRITWKENPKGPFDGTLTIDFKEDKFKFLAEVKTELRTHQVHNLVKRFEKEKQLIFIAAKIYPATKNYLREHKLAYLEANGNIYINKNGLIVWIDTNKPLQLGKPKNNRAFTKTGIKTIFHFLLDQNLVNQTHREIAMTVKIGLGNVNYILNGLKETGFLINYNNKQYKLIEKQKLLEKWIEAYKEKLQPDLLIGTFRFLKEINFTNWKEIPIKKTKTFWGGEPAGDILTNHLRPEELTLYTLETRPELIKNYRLIPDAKGNVRVFKKFWQMDKLNDHVVPPLLVYADLINKNDKRCTETAQMIYDEFIKEHI